MRTIRKQKTRHFYTGEKKPVSTVQKIVHVTLMNKRKQPRVVTKSFGVQKANKVSIILAVESTPTERCPSPLEPAVADFASDKEQNDGCAAQNAEETHSKKVGHLFHLNFSLLMDPSVDCLCPH